MNNFDSKQILYSSFSYMVLVSLQRVLGIFIFDFLYVLDSVILFRNRIYPVDIMSELCVRFHQCWVVIE